MSRFPRISTRGYYDLTYGRTLKTNSYFLFPKKSFKKMYGENDLTIMIHGMRNDKAGAITKFKIAKRKLKSLGYNYPVIGFSYDANTKGAHIKKYEVRAMRAGQKIAKKNGKNLSQFILDFKLQSSKTKIRLMGHSLGSEVILSTLEHLSKKSSQPLVESIHFFGASIPSNVLTSRHYSRIFKKIVRGKIVNCYSPTDEVLQYSNEKGQVKKPLGLFGISGKPISKYVQKKLKPKNHRFVSYATALKSFP